jgi:hypothetical protein
MEASELQRKLSVSLLNRALGKDRAVSFAVGGETEKYIKCSFEGISIYLYDDAFDLQGSNMDSRFEPDDIASIDDALSKLNRELDTLLLD